MKYDIITASSTADVVLKVQRRLNEGWELFGPPFAKEGMFPVAQAMVLRPNMFDILNRGTSGTESSGPG